MIYGDNSFKIHDRCLIFISNNQYCNIAGFSCVHLYLKNFNHYFSHFRNFKASL